MRLTGSPRITVKRSKRLERRFWQAGGGYDRNVWEPKILLAMIEYIHNNPVRRGLASQSAELEVVQCWLGRKEEHSASRSD